MAYLLHVEIMLLLCVGPGGATAAVVVVDVVDSVGVGDGLVSEVATQYAYPTQRPEVQSEDMLGFHFRKSADEMRLACSMLKQLSPDCATYHFTQLLGCPV
jgi:hypothetical protein